MISLNLEKAYINKIVAGVDSDALLQAEILMKYEGYLEYIYQRNTTV